MTVHSKRARPASSDTRAEVAGPNQAVPLSRRPSRRDAILQAAIDLFAKGGSRGTCIAAIAERIGVTPAAVIHHFKTKEALLREVVAEIDNRRPGLEREDGVEGNRLRQIGSWGRLLEQDDELANLARLAAVITAEALDPDHASHEYFVARQREFQSTAREIIQSGIIEGWIRDDIDPAVLAITVVGVLNGTQLQWFLDPERVPIRAALETAFDLLASALTPVGPPTRSASKKKRASA
jgi:AcrR family transcriptional regulator